MKQLVRVTNEKELSALYQKKKYGTFKILFTSTWDKSCLRLEKVIAKWEKKEGDEILYVINSWDLPAAFSMYTITSVPSLVHLKKGRVRVDVEYPTVYRFFDAS